LFNVIIMIPINAMWKCFRGNEDFNSLSFPILLCHENGQYPCVIQNPQNLSFLLKSSCVAKIVQISPFFFVKIFLCCQNRPNLPLFFLLKCSCVANQLQHAAASDSYEDTCSINIQFFHPRQSFYKQFSSLSFLVGVWWGTPTIRKSH